MKSLVTGGGGFLGSYIVKALLKRGDEVHVIGRNHYPEIAELGAICHQADISDLQQIQKLFAGVDEVYHAAAIAGIWGKWSDYERINVIGTQNVLFSARTANVPKFIFTVTDIPYTISGKKVEKAVLYTIIGREVKNKDALANPNSLSQYSNLEF